jgi:thioesterase-3
MPHSKTIKVRGYHLDLYGHVNNARYLEFLEEARWSFFEDCGDLPRFLASTQALIVVNINIDYRFPATMGNELRIESTIQSVRNRSVIIHQQVSLADSGKLVAEADVTFVAFDSTQQRAAPLNAELKALLASMQEARQE